jgi:hypothetical protein
MGLYSNGKIYGVSWRIYGDDDSYLPKKKFEKIFPDVMTGSDIQEIAQEYEKLSELEKKNTQYSIYTLCSCTYNQDTADFMSWMPSNNDTINTFLLNKK